MRMLREKASHGISKMQGEQMKECVKFDKDTTNIERQKTKNLHSNNQPLQQTKLRREGNCESPVIMMKLKRNLKGTTKDPEATAAAAASFEEEVSSRMPLKLERSHQQLLLERQTSRSLFHLKRANSKLIRRPVVKKRVDMKYAPHSTINMRLSSEPGSFELYGGGLPPDQSSHLSIIKVTTS